MILGAAAMLFKVRVKTKLDGRFDANIKSNCYRWSSTVKKNGNIIGFILEFMFTRGHIIGEPVNPNLKILRSSWFFKCLELPSLAQGVFFVFFFLLVRSYLLKSV